MVKKKSKGSLEESHSVEAIDIKRNSYEDDVKPVKKKLKKRKSMQNGADDQTGEKSGNAGNIGNLCDETRETGENVSPAKKRNKGPMIKNAEGNPANSTAVCRDEKNPSPAKKVQKKTISSETPKSTKEISVQVAKGHTFVNDGKNNRGNQPKTQEKMREICTSYLKVWKENRLKWQFIRRYEKWLIENMLNASTVPEDLFPIFLEYISRGKDQIRKLVYEKAAEKIKEAKIGKTELIRAQRIVKTVKIDGSCDGRKIKQSLKVPTQLNPGTLKIKPQST